MIRLNAAGRWNLFAVAILLAGTAPTVRAETLSDAVALAYQSNPTLLSAREQLKTLNEAYVQALSGYRPQAAVTANFDYNKSTATYQTGVDTAAATLSLSQPIYTGGLVTAEVRAAMADILSGREKLRQTEADVLQSVVQAYVDVRRDQEAVSISQNNVDALRRQLGEVKARFDVGQITHTDLAQAQARVSQAEAQHATAFAQLNISRAGYVAVVGQSPGDLAPPPALAGLPTDVEDAFTAADRNNASILAADLAERAAAARVAVARAANRPTISLRAAVGGDGASSEPPVVQSQPIGDFKPDISASVVFNQPLFTGGLNASKIREALDQDDIQRIAAENARRLAIQAVSQAWNQLKAARESVSFYQEVVDADKIAFDGTRQEALVGLRSTIEVLNAAQELDNAELSLAGAKHDEYMASTALLNATGALGINSLTSNVTPYNIEKAFKKVRRSGAMPWDPVVSTVDALGSPGVPKTPKPAPMVVAAPIKPATSGSSVVQ